MAISSSSPGPARIAPWLLIAAVLLPSPATLGSDRQPTRCVARWQGPVEGCALHEAVTTEGLGASERAARKRALANLAAATESAWVQKAASLPDGARVVFLEASRSCGEVEERAVFSCFPEPHLSSARYCWLQIEEDPCGQSQGFFLAGKAWSNGEQVRREICGETPERPFEEDAISSRDAACRASCWQRGKLNCGAGR
jgi:hypothetical protein